MSRDLDALVASLDLEEKTSFLAGAEMWSTIAIDRLGIPPVFLTDGPNGARGPALPSSMDTTSTSTSTSMCMPSGAALGATWDTEIVERVGAVIGAEARMKACRVLLGPTVNLHRTPLGGRNFESYSEEPLLAGRLGAAWIRGAQSQGVACTVKHFAGNESEDGRMVVDSVIDRRTLREVHLRPFEIAVREGGALGIMTAYNRLNGEYCSDSSWLLRDVLRGEWGFEGFVVSDWFAFADTESAIRAGLDLEMPGPGRAYGPALLDAVRSGRVDEADVDAAVRRLSAVFDRIGAFDDDPSIGPRSDDLPQHRAIGREAAAASIVLLKNDGVLPLTPTAGRSVALIGPNAGRAVIMGGGSASLAVPTTRTPLEALRERFGTDVEISFEPGVDISLHTPEIPGEWLRADGAPGVAVDFWPLDEAFEGDPIHRDRFDTGSMTWWFNAPAGVPQTFAWRARTTLEVPTSGRYVLSLVQTEPSELSIDGDLAIDSRGSEVPAGHEFFGLGRREQVVELDLEAGRPIEIELRSVVTRSGLVLGAKVGLRPALPTDAIDRAVDLASRCDDVVVIVGTDGDWETEGHDREALGLPGRQDELVERILVVAPNATVVLNVGSMVTIPWASRCRSLLQNWFGGLEAADALAEVLVGDRDPGGRLPMTIPARIEDGPAFANPRGEGGRVVYGERVLVGHRWYDARDIEVTFPFGHGSSYASFDIGVPTPSSATLAPDGAVRLSVPIANTSERGGSEVVQLYVEGPSCGVVRPSSWLVDFAKVTLGPGESTVAELVVDGRSLARWVDVDPAYEALTERQSVQAAFMPPPAPAEPEGWIVDAGRYLLRVARSSRDVVHSVIVSVPEAGPPAPPAPSSM